MTEVFLARRFLQGVVPASPRYAVDNFSGGGAKELSVHKGEAAADKEDEEEEEELLDSWALGTLILAVTLLNWNESSTEDCRRLDT
ncbi:OLC1v1007759C1 [Oldenlandia corymbosa var. corymbosa]|uniref:OLC1v1007759C1 n=1 Tax=Oldenlandia corymbosa var. corymbosa TaxID=529605 RepID=A0AAV1DND0_OLDCO|nr:OLC1v1007759C1 [Oldenlandia corymbosa var. corymbosa]